jgi:hypothetical protein
LCFGPALLALGPLYVLYTGDITQHVFLYRGVPGPVGVSGLLGFVGGLEAVSSYAPFFTVGLVLAMGGATAALWRRPKRVESDVALVAAVFLVGVFLFGTGYCPQYWLWSAPMLVVAYVYQGRAFRSMVVIAAVLAVLDGTLAFAYDRDIGAFLNGRLSGALNTRLIDWFNVDVRYKAVIFMPLSAATLVLWVYGVWLLMRSGNGPEKMDRELAGTLG